MCIYICVYMCVYIYIYVCVYMYVCIYVCVYICMCVYMYVCIYVCVYICMCIYIYIYVCIYNPILLNPINNWWIEPRPMFNMNLCLLDLNRYLKERLHRKVVAAIACVWLLWFYWKPIGNQCAARTVLLSLVNALVLRGWVHIEKPVDQWSLQLKYCE